MLYDYIKAQERVKLLQPKRGWRALFSWCCKNKQNQIVQKNKCVDDYHQQSNCHYKKKTGTSVWQCNANQSLCINEHIHIVVLSACKGITHIGIEAPVEARIIKTECQRKVLSR